MSLIYIKLVCFIVFLVGGGAVVSEEDLYSQETLMKLADEYAVLMGGKICEDQSYRDCMSVSYTDCEKDIGRFQDLCLENSKKKNINDYQQNPILIVSPYVNCLISEHASLYEKDICKKQW